MSSERLYDIAEICKLLGTTSRTLRFYEEKGIITSTTVGISARRQYTEEQLARIRNVLVLRTLGLSVKAIADLQAKKSDLREAVLSKRAEIYASINSRAREINLLNEALIAIDAEKCIFTEIWQHAPHSQPQEIDIALRCTVAIVSGDSDALYRHLSTHMLDYMPLAVFEMVRKETFAPLGEFVSMDEIVVDQQFPNRIYSKVKFAKRGLVITFVFYNELIHGLWLGYYDAEEKTLC